jgi:pimeloyl-ACP methyl ester carboxylesterase
MKFIFESIFVLIFAVVAATVTADAARETTLEKTFPITVFGEQKSYRVKVFFPTDQDPTSHKPIGLAIFPGSAAGLPEEQARYYASLGYVAAAVEYFGYDPFGERPYTITQLPLEGIENILKWLKSSDGPRLKKVIIRGRSRGGELALLLGEKYSNLIDGIIAEVPSLYVWGDRANGAQSRFISWQKQAPLKETEVSSWTYQGNDIPFVPMDGLLHDRAEEWQSNGLPHFRFEKAYSSQSLKYRNKSVGKKARIKVEKINVPVLLTGGLDDMIWPSGRDVTEIRRLRRQHFASSRDTYIVKKAGHVWSSEDMSIEFPSGAYDRYVDKSLCQNLNSIHHEVHRAEIKEKCGSASEADLVKGIYFSAKEIGVTRKETSKNSEAQSIFLKEEKRFIEQISSQEN